MTLCYLYLEQLDAVSFITYHTQYVFNSYNHFRVQTAFLASHLLLVEHIAADPFLFLEHP